MKQPNRSNRKNNSGRKNIDRCNCDRGFFLRAGVLIVLLATSSLTVLNHGGKTLAGEQPNIVIILADDLGWNAVGYRNPRMETPNIDRLVRQGMELEHFYVAPMCSPTRAGLLTGRYPIRFGCARAVIPPQRDHGLPVTETTLAEALAAKGYENRGIFGKWHLGHRRTKWHPLQQGFSQFIGHYNGAIDYFDLTREGERDWHHQFEPSAEEGYATDLIAEAAAEFITTSASQQTPYLCYVPFNAPHSPFQAPEEAIKRFESLSELEGLSGKNRKQALERLKIYSAMIWRMDQGIGKILAAIESTNTANNTMVWFLSDNGGVGNIWENNTPLRGSKLTVYEGGIRVPAVVRWPAKIPAGSKLHSTAGYIDVFPTLLAAAETVESPTGKQAASENFLDGINLLPLLVEPKHRSQAAFNTAREKIDQRPWYSYHGQQGEESEHLSVLQNGWKLKVNGQRLTQVSDLNEPNVQHELFYLATDPNEQRNQSQQNPETVNRLAHMLVEYRNLQPQDAVPRYGVGAEGFKPHDSWRAAPESPEKLLGSSPLDAGSNQ
ncbi:MAG: sulfatase-like hydrolase/transferase [Rubripirellula sp.]